MKIKVLLIGVLSVLLLVMSGCHPPVTNDKESISAKEYQIQSHAKVRYDLVKKVGNDTPYDYTTIAECFETFTGGVDGNITEHYSRSEGEKYYNFYYTTWTYDENSNLLSHVKTMSYPSGDLNSSPRFETEFQYYREYEYDEFNCCIRELRYSGIDNSAPKEVLTYEDFDEHKNPRKEHMKKTILGHTLIPDGNDYTGADTYRDTNYEYQYDKSGNMILKKSTYDDGYGETKSSYTSYKYDKNNNLVAEVSDGEENYNATYWEYDKNNNMTCEKKYRSGELTETTYSYDEQGNAFEFALNGETKETYKNEYDDEGNLVRRYTYVNGECKYYDIWEYVSWDEWTAMPF